MAVGLGQTVVDDEAVAVLYQRMPHEAELGFLARPLAVKPRLRIGRRSMRLVGALLTMEIRLAVPPSARRRRFVRSVCRPKALHRRPGFDQRAIDREGIRGPEPNCGASCTYGTAARDPGAAGGPAGARPVRP